MNNPFALSYMMISLVAAGFIYFGLVASLRREQFRCQVRRIRDDLFDFMWENSYDFKEPSYLKARESMNAVLALSNKLSPLVLMMTGTAAVLHLRRYGPSPANPPLPDGPLGDKIRQSYIALVLTLIEFSVLRGIPGLLFRSVLWVLTHAFHLSGRVSLFKGKIVKYGADYLQGAGIRSPLRFT